MFPGISDFAVDLARMAAMLRTNARRVL